MIWAIIPVKAGYESKSRLAHVLSAEERADVIRGILRRTLSVLDQVPAVEKMLIVSRDPAVLAIARESGALALFEDGVPGLNTAVTRAVRLAELEGATAALVLPADLPFMQAGDIEMMLGAMGTANYNGHHAAGGPPLIAICPDSKDQGTNALLVSLPTELAFHYGPGSFHRHCQEAARLGAAVQVVHAPGLKFDLDTEEDWRLYQATVKSHNYPIS